jgi:hypothetical protein
VKLIEYLAFVEILSLIRRRWRGTNRARFLLEVRGYLFTPLLFAPSLENDLFYVRLRTFHA